MVYPLDYHRNDFSCEFTDVEGNQVLLDIGNVANRETGEGYTSYIWLIPASEELEIKTTYVIGVELEGETVAVGAGVYGMD